MLFADETSLEFQRIFASVFVDPFLCLLVLKVFTFYYALAIHHLRIQILSSLLQLRFVYDDCNVGKLSYFTILLELLLVGVNAPCNEPVCKNVPLF